jgi:hypothetical protein
MQNYIFFRFNFDRSADKLRMPRDVFEFFRLSVDSFFR